MFFPWNIESAAKSGGKDTSKEKIQVAIGVFVLANIAIFIFVVSTFQAYGIPVWIGLLAQFLVMLMIGVFVFRFFIFDENAKLEEYRAGESFIKYYKLRKGLSEEYNILGRKVFAYEYENGSCMFVVQMKYGSNDTLKVSSTENVIRQILSLLYANRLEFKTIVMPEDFLSGVEARWLMQSISKTKGTKRGATGLKLTNRLLEETKNSNIECLYLMVKTTAIYQKYDLDGVIRTIMELLTRNTTCFREVNFLDEAGVNMMFRDFYGLEVIDLSAIKSVESDNRTINAYQDMVSVYRIISSEGKTFTKGKEASSNRTSAIKL